MFIDKETRISIQEEYPPGCRVVLDRMDDPRAPSIGTQGTVRIVDDIGTVHVAWDNGSGLGVCYGEDSCHKIRTEEEAKETINFYGRSQPSNDAICPRCGERMPGKKFAHALSRWADIMVCDFCGGMEAMESAGLVPKKPLMEWSCVEKPQKGEGAWKGGSE